MNFLRRLFGPRQIGPNDVIKHDQADSVIFFAYDEVIAVENCVVTLFANGIVHIRSEFQESTAHITVCEILWRNDTPDGEEPKNNLRVLKPKDDK